MRSSCVLLISLILNLVCAAANVQAADDVVAFDDPDQSAMYHDLLREYRCLKCQNQNLADSNASLAGDLRREIHDQILAGNDKSDIDEYLVTRYGEFVLYRPRFNAKTAILWIGPFVLLLVAMTALVFMIRNRSGRARSGVPNDGLDDSMLDSGHASMEQEKLEKARRLLSD